MDFTSFVIPLAIVAAAVLLLPRLMGPQGPRCNRCDATGNIDERWPDPSKPGGWHVASGTCPKCGGKGRLRR